MKTIMTIVAMFFAVGMFAQTKQSVAVLNIDSKGVVQDAQTMGYLVKLEVEKTNVYSVLDKYEVADIIKNNNIDINNCYAKSCLVETGKLLKVDKMISGSAERFGEKIVITLRLIDVNSSSIEKNETTEYLNLPEMQKMIEISVKKMLGIKPDQEMVEQLIDYNVPIESPKNTLRLNGPRMGCSYTMGESAKILSTNKPGGFDMFPATFNFGWQHEFKYISAGNFQALVENIVMIGGLESGRFIPSYTPMLGFRFGKGAWEFGFGPTFRIIKKARGYYDRNNEWNISNDWKADSTNAFHDEPGYFDDGNNYVKYEIKNQLDSRGDISLSTGLVFAIGKTFHSGYLNIPVNIYIAPRRDGSTIGFMFGFNIQKKRKI